MTNEDLAAIGRRLLKPYRIPAECPYLSEDQRELSELDLKGRSAWMAEWLLLAHKAPRAAKPAPSWESAPADVPEDSAIGPGEKPPPRSDRAVRPRKR